MISFRLFDEAQLIKSSQRKNNKPIFSGLYAVRVCVWLTDFIDYSLSENHGEGGMKRIPVGPEWQVSTGFSAQYLFLSFPSQRCFFLPVNHFLFSRPCDSDGSTRIKKRNKQMVSKSL